MISSYKNMGLCIAFLFTFYMQAQSTFIVGGWVPYWKIADALASVKEHIAYVNELSPFSYEIDKRGMLTDRFAEKKQEWTELFRVCRQEKIPLIPSLFWSDAEAMHQVLNDKRARTLHIDEILKKIVSLKFGGVNIDYENVSSQDRKAYLEFIKELSQRLHKEGLELHCTIEGRTGDTTLNLIQNGKEVEKLQEISIKSSKGLPNNYYKKVLCDYCDRVIIMAYDELGKAYLYNSTNLKNQYYLSHSSKQWIEQIVHYVSSFIPASKIILGIPTYGIEYTVFEKDNAILLKKAGNPTYVRATAIAQAHKIEPQRTDGGELCFTFSLNEEKHYVCYLDAASIQERINLAKKYGLKGVYLFKIDGAEDKSMWPYLKAAFNS